MVKGRWIPFVEDEFPDGNVPVIGYHCSICGKYNSDNEDNYCSNCGALMHECLTVTYSTPNTEPLTIEIPTSTNETITIGETHNIQLLPDGDYLITDYPVDTNNSETHSTHDEHEELIVENLLL